MNRLAFTLAGICCVCAGIARAQSPAPAPVSQPTSPAPAVESAPNAPAAVVVQAPNAATAPVSTPTGVTQIVYTPQLPSAAELTNAAAAQGFTVERIVQTSTQVIVSYRNANGQPVNVAYQSLPPTASAATAAPAVVVTSPPPAVITSPPPTVVYESAPRVIYYDYPRYYYPPVWYPPVSFSFGFGYHSWRGGGHFRHR